MKIRTICIYEGVQSLSIIACKFGFVVSTVNTIKKYTASIKGCVKERVMMKLITIIKKCKGAISEMENYTKDVDGSR
jgi:hypothetical protein